MLLLTILTGQGDKLMELTEFAPLQQHGPKFKDAPRHLDVCVKSGLLLDLVQKKSERQGGNDRFLVIYTTEEGFSVVDSMTVEIMRRALDSHPPRFERIYYLVPLGANDGMVHEIFPGRPHPIHGTRTDEELRQAATTFVHPHELTQQWEFTRTMPLPNYGASIIRIRLLRPLLFAKGLLRFSKPFIFVQRGQNDPSMPEPQPRRPDEPEDELDE